MPTPPNSTLLPRSQPHKAEGWTLVELLVVTAIFTVATVLLVVVFEDQDSFTNRTVIEGLKNGVRDALIREMTERNGNGYVLLENGQQGYSYVQGGQYPYRLTGVAGAMGIDSASAQTTSFTLQVDKLTNGTYVPLSGLLSGELLTLVYYPDGRNESAVPAATPASNPVPPSYGTVINRSSLGNRTIFYLQKNGKPVSNRVEFSFYSGRNVNANASTDTTGMLTSGGTVSQVRINVSPLGNITAVNNLNTNSTTLQLIRSGSNIGTSVSIPADLK